jgi:hypothetical protein
MKRLGNNAVCSDEMQGAIEKTDSRIEVGTLKIELDRDIAWALCNVLGKDHIERECGMQLNKNQHAGLIKLGAAIGAFVDHPNRQFEHLDT